MQNIGRRYFADLQNAEIWNDFRFDDVSLGVPSVLLQSGPHILLVELIESDDADIERPLFHLNELPFPFLSLSAGLEPALGRANSLARIVAIGALDEPGAEL